MMEEMGESAALNAGRSDVRPGGKRIAWGITGAGHYLAESLEAMRSISRRNKVCTFVSSAGEEVLRMYGLSSGLKEVSRGGYLEEVFLESASGKSFPMAGRFMLARFDLLIVAPATSNTVAKMVAGIADGLVTNAVALANKSGVPVYVLPTDVKGYDVSRMPYAIDRELCQLCDPCPPRDSCPKGAIQEQIDLMSCDGCGLCVSLCSAEAIRGGLLRIETRSIDRMNIERLRSLPGFTVLEGPEEIERIA
jgi:dihydromethanopterin reductase (acceptor)